MKERKTGKLGRLGWEDGARNFSPSFHPYILPSKNLPSFHALRFTFHVFLALVCVWAVGCSRSQPQVSTADLRAYLQPVKAIETYAGFETKNHRLYFGNRLIERHILLDSDAKPIQTIQYWHKPSGRDYVALPSAEFRFRVGAINFSGDSELLSYDSYRIEQGVGGKRRITIRLTYFATQEDAFSGLKERIESLHSVDTDQESTTQGSEQGDVPPDESTESPESRTDKTPVFHLKLHYDIHPNLPVIRKWFTVQNLTDVPFSLEDIAVESLPLFAGMAVDLHIWGASHLGQSSESTSSDSISIPWRGGASEGFVVLWDAKGNGGVVFGNEGVGLLKYYQISLGDSAKGHSAADTPSPPVVVSAGMPPAEVMNGVALRVPPKGSVGSPVVWTMLFDGDRDAVAEMLERMEVLSAQPLHTPALVWTKPSLEWHPPSEVGQDSFVAVDYDWNSENDSILKEMSQQIHDRGNKFAIRLPIAVLSTKFLDRPTWELTPTPVFRFPTKEDAEESDEEPEVKQVTYCVLSDYGYYVLHIVKTLLTETSPDLLIFDRALLGTSDSLLMGCSAYGHAHYSRAESIPLTYRWLFGFANHLRQQYPGLQLGITSAAYGVDHADSACLAHFDFFLR